MRSKPKIRISAQEILSDIRSGLTDSQLIDKYKISARGLESALRKLQNSGFITSEELSKRLPSFEDTVDLDDLYQLNITCSSLSLSAYEERNPTNTCQVWVAGEKTVEVRGVEARVGEIKNFVILATEYPEIAPLEFAAKCGKPRAGNNSDEGCRIFEITHISEESLSELRKIVQIARNEL